MPPPPESESPPKPKPASAADLLHFDLLLKLTALLSAQQRLIRLITSANKGEIGRELQRAEIEVQIVQAHMAVLKSKPIQLPTDEKIAELQLSTAKLAKETEKNGTVNQLIAALDRAINAWPVA
jgi:hypothetical protein